MIPLQMIQDIRSRNLLPRLVALALALFPLVFIREFWLQLNSYATGAILPWVIQKRWDLAIIHIAVFLAFLIPLSYRRHVHWSEYGIASAFFISLFIEMFGIPLTIFLAARTFTNSPEKSIPTGVITSTFGGEMMTVELAMVYGLILAALGALLILAGWVTLYRAARRGMIATTGPYSISRHPQYVGFILIIIGWTIGWPTPLTLIMAPILIYRYVKVCYEEEQEFVQNRAYQHYQRRVPMFM